MRCKTSGCSLRHFHLFPPWCRSISLCFVSVHILFFVCVLVNTMRRKCIFHLSSVQLKKWRNVLFFPHFVVDVKQMNGNAAKWTLRDNTLKLESRKCIWNAPHTHIPFPLPSSQKNQLGYTDNYKPCRSTGDSHQERNRHRVKHFPKFVFIRMHDADLMFWSFQYLPNEY